MSFTVTDLARAIGKDENYVRQHIRRKNLAARKDGRRLFVEEAEAARWARERGLPLGQAIRTPESGREVSTRTARMTVLALRSPNETSMNMFTLVRHRDRGRLGPWVKVVNPTWYRETTSVENSDQSGSLLLYCLDATLAKCQEIVKGILQNGVLTIEGNEIQYALERWPRRHWSYRVYTESHRELLESPFGGHSAELTEYWSFDAEPQERWMAALKVDNEASRAMAKALHFPIDQRPDRAGNLMIASAQDAIESEITANRGKSLILRVSGNSWTTPPPGAYSATVWASHSGDRVAHSSTEIVEPETVINCDADADRVGYAIYRNSDGQCIDQYEAFLMKSVTVTMAVAGPEVRMNIKTNGNSIKVGTSLGTKHETIRVEDDRSEKVDQAIRTKYLSYRAWEEDQTARKERGLARFGPEELEDAIAHITNLIGQQGSSKDPIYFADPYFMGESLSDAEIKLMTAILSGSRGQPLNILLGGWKNSRNLNYPAPLVAQAVIKSFTRVDGRPAFHDRYLITGAGETLITNSVNGWGKHGVTFDRLSYGVYRAEAEKLWSLSAGTNGNGIIVEEVDPW